EAADHVMGTIDEDFAQLVHKELYDHGVEVIVKEGLAEITADKAILGSGRAVPAQAVILAIGVAPETELAAKIGCKLGLTGGIAVDQHYQTSIPNIYAVGDAIEVTHMLTRKKTRLALAFPAQMEARDAIDHMYGRPIENQGVIGSAAIHVFDLN